MSSNKILERIVEVLTELEENRISSNESLENLNILIECF